MAKPNLQDLPEELVSNISLRLWSDDVQALRLTCRALEKKILYEWATEYFSEKAFVISTDSLKVLMNIANSEKLRGFLHRVNILTAFFSDTAFDCDKVCPHGNGCGWAPTVRQREAWEFLCEDQKQLKDSGRDKEMLTEAFSKLPELADILVVDSTAAVPADVDIRMLRKVSRLCGRNFQVPSSSKDNPEYHKILSHVWSITTTAIANSGVSTLKGFGTGLGKGTNPICVPLDLRFSDTKLVRLKAALKTVDRFGLQLTTRLSPKASAAQLQTFKKAGPPRAQKLAAALPALDTLALDFESMDTDRVIFSSFMQPLDLSKMTKLQLSTLVTDRQSLMAVFDRLVSVQHLFMTFVDLSKGSWIPVLKQLQGMEDHLEHLHMMYLLEAGKKAYFLEQLDEDGQMGEDDMMGFGDMMVDVAAGDDFDDEDTDDELPPLETMDGEPISAGTAAHPPTNPLPTTVEEETWSPTAEQLDPISSSAGPSSTANPKKTKKEAPKPGSPDYHASLDHKAPGNERYAERGYYVCIRGREEIKAQLKIFVQEYNLGDDISADGPMGGMMGGGMGGMLGGGMGGVMGGTVTIPVGGGPGTGNQPPDMNNFLNGLAGYLGLPPMPGHNGAGAGPGHGGHHGGANQSSGGNNANATAATTATQNGNPQATVGAAAASANAPTPPPAMGTTHLGLGTMPMGFQDFDFFMGGPPAPGVAGAGATGAAGAHADDEWNTDEGSEFTSDAEA